MRHRKFEDLLTMTLSLLAATGTAYHFHTDGVHKRMRVRTRPKTAFFLSQSDRFNTVNNITEALPTESPAFTPADESTQVINARPNSKELDDLLSKIHSYCPDSDDDMVIRAYHFAEKAHCNQQRKSGEPYLIHPISVANIIADMKLDVPTIVAGLLHDTVEDCDDVSMDDISSNFSEEVGSLVDGVTKITKIKYDSRRHRQIENYRKMIISMSKDIRVILIKLGDRLYNIRTLRHMPENKQKEKARETLELFAPLAHRLGMHRIKEELEDKSFRYLEPKMYAEIEKQVEVGTEERQQYIGKVIDQLNMYLADSGIDTDSVKISGRSKSCYSIWRKMQSQDIPVEEIMDLVAFRIVVDDIAQCYQCLGIVHSQMVPVPGRFKDYIALPKENGYKSLHTTVIGPEGKRIEIQIRTQAMHDTAEHGVAAHWVYKGGSKDGSDEEVKRFRWLKQLVEWAQESGDSSEFIKSVKEDLLFEKEVFVFSPRGELFSLPQNSKVLDFAFAVHSDVGSRCVGGKINGKMASLRQKLHNGDTIEVLTSSDQVPRREWLKFVKTSKAQARIRSFLKQEQRQESIAIGKGILEKELKRRAPRSDLDVMKAYRSKLGHLLTVYDLKDEESIFSALAYGQISLESVIADVGIPTNESIGGLSREEQSDADLLQILEDKAQSHSLDKHPTQGDGIVVGGERNVLISFCKNCNPLRGEDVKGVITRGKGIKVHRLGCKYLLESDERRRLDASWDTSAPHTSKRAVRLDVICEDQAGILAAMSKCIASLKFDIRSVNLKKLSNNRGLARFEVMLSNIDDLETLTYHLLQEKGVISVSRK